MLTSTSMKYRSRLDIVAAMLRAMTETGVSRTKLMYSGLLSYAQLREYLPFLEERDLITRDRDSNLYTLTANGLEVLRLYDEMSSILEGNRSQVPVVETSMPSWLRLGPPRPMPSREGR